MKPKNAITKAQLGGMHADIEQALRLALRSSKHIPQDWKEQYRFIPGRQFRADFAWPEWHILAECDGGTWVKGRGHSSGSGIEIGYQRANLAQLHDFLIFRFTTAMIASGEALITLEAIFDNLRVAQRAALIGFDKALARIQAQGAH
jgi:hypothetical protein